MPLEVLQRVKSVFRIRERRPVLFWKQERVKMPLEVLQRVKSVPRMRKRRSVLF
jgi:hypothetical protein